MLVHHVRGLLADRRVRGAGATQDFRSVERIGLLGTTNDKDAVLFSSRIGGRWAMLHRPAAGGTEHIWLTRSLDLKHWGDPACVLLEGERPAWDRLRIEGPGRLRC